jgi:hypothetical protein
MNEEEEIPLDYPNVEIYIIDLKTSASKDIPFWSETNRMLEICIRQPSTDRMFYRVCDPGPSVRLPEVSHKAEIISRDTIRCAGKATAVVLKEMLEFVEAGMKEVLMIAYDAQYVLNILLKELFLELQKEYGEQSVYFPWYIFDSISFAKDKLEELRFCYERKYQPYSLDRMARHFKCTSSLLKINTAFGDCMIIEELFMSVFRQVAGEAIDNLGKLKWTAQFYNKSNIVLSRALSDVRGVTDEMSENLHSVIQTAFKRHGGDDFETFVHSHHLFRVADLLLYASLKLRMRQDKSKGEESLRKACGIIEVLLRSKGVFIQDDQTIVEILAAMCQTTAFCFIYHTYVPPTEAFPIIRTANSICFRPLMIDDSDAELISARIGFFSITELYAVYKQLDYVERNLFVQAINEQITRPITLQVLNFAFDTLNKPNYMRVKEYEQKQEKLIE